MDIHLVSFRIYVDYLSTLVFFFAFLRHIFSVLVFFGIYGVGIILIWYFLVFLGSGKCDFGIFGVSKFRY